MQDSQSLKAEITSALDRLSLDSLKMLARFVIFLRTDTGPEEIQSFNVDQQIELPPQSARIISPRLAHREQVADFKKEIIEIADDTL